MERAQLNPLLRLWQRSDNWPDWIGAWAEPLIAWLHCRVYGHIEFLEMDNRSICCAVCANYLRDKERSP